ncbi:hypothetical protein A2313_03765 [Candidatus Roizmanbacteria bacterium RIFOXYB2_FULL_41_10]|nr:MAG: hypothetical protein A2313_03765 [Candidatus Roizmanbacteria bacterium RIFOXYB2_FULL_41_10]
MTNEVKLKIAFQEARIGMVKHLVKSIRASLIRNNRMLQTTQKAIQDYGELLDQLERELVVLNGELSVIKAERKESEVL